MENVRTLMEKLLLSYQRITKEVLKNVLPSISAVQYKILYETMQREGLSMQEMANRLKADLTTFSRQVQSLQKAGYLYKSLNASDRRIYRLYITNEGKTAVESVNEHIQKELDQMLTNMNSFEEEVILRSLTELSKKMTALNI